MCQALTAHVLGQGTEFHLGPGPDGGRDAWFDGRTAGFPDPAAPWDGYIILQAFHSPPGRRAGDASTRLKHRIKADFDRWSQQREAGAKQPDYVIFATNLQVSVNEDALQRLTGYIDDRARTLGLRGWQIWDEARITELLGTYTDVRQAVASLSMANEIVSGVLARLSAAPPAASFRPGEPGQEATFQAVYEAAGGIDIVGHALGTVQELELSGVS